MQDGVAEQRALRCATGDPTKVNTTPLRNVTDMLRKDCKITPGLLYTNLMNLQNHHYNDTYLGSQWNPIKSISRIQIALAESCSWYEPNMFITSWCCCASISWNQGISQSCELLIPWQMQGVWAPTGIIGEGFQQVCKSFWISSDPLVICGHVFMHGIVQLVSFHWGFESFYDPEFNL